MTQTQKTIPGKQPAYVYRCVHKETNRFYIGYREANNLPPVQDLGKAYFTSSKVVSKNFSDYNYEVLAEYDTGKMAFDVEQRLLYELRNDKMLINGGIPKNPKKLIPANLEIFKQELVESAARKENHEKNMQSVIDGLAILLQIELTTLHNKKEYLRNKNLEIVEISEKFLYTTFGIPPEKQYKILKGLIINGKNIKFSVNLLEIKF